MESKLGKNWQDNYPTSLTKQEKESLKFTLKTQFAKSQGKPSDLLDYLRAIKILDDYPEPTQGLASHQVPNVATVMTVVLQAKP